MARLTKHAIQRLQDRYGMTGRDVEIIGSRLSDPNSYELIKQRRGKNGELRATVYNEMEIHGVIVDNVVVTVIWPVFDQDEECASITDLRRGEVYKKQVSGLMKQISDMKSELQKKSGIISDVEYEIESLKASGFINLFKWWRKNRK